MPGLWERLAGSERGSLESSDCESLGSASGSEGGERGPESCGGWARGGQSGVERAGGAAGSRGAAVERHPEPRADPSRPADPDQTSLPDLELLHDPEDELLSARLLELVQAALGSAPLGSRRRSRLLMPAQLAAQLRSELLRLACSEPCGLRGALLDLCVEHGKACHDVGRIAADPAVVPTFQLTLVLRLDSRLWPKIQGLLASAPALSPAFGQSLKLSTGFTVMKKKLYSSEQLLVEEC
uniref:DNA damage-inducible transcript 4 protein n=1 Tax=Phasianus colchicus TaxID=9054 RepID=A0A669Q4J4_PHACC